MAQEVKVIDKGWNAIKKNLAGLKVGKVASVGVQGPEASQSHGELTNATLYSYHEFGDMAGTGHPPERSSLRSTMADKESEYQKELQKIGKGAFEGGTVEGNLLLLGEKYRADVINKIKEGIPPALKDETIEQKRGETTPLITTGQLINALSAIVKNASDVERSE